VILFGCPILKTIIVEKVLTPYSEGEGRDEGNVFELRHNTQIDMFGSEALEAVKVFEKTTKNSQKLAVSY